MICYSCGKETGFKDYVGRGDSCPHCHRDAKVCKNCQFYDPKAYNECREPAAERIVEKEKSNFCDHFVPLAGPRAPLGGPSGPKAVPAGLDPKAAADALFKKK